MRWIGWSLLCVAGCAAGPDTLPDPHRPIDGVDEVSQPLSDLTAQCGFSPSTHIMAITLDAGDIAVIARATGGALLINDLPCGAATVTTTHRINVTEGTSGDQTLIFDFGGGLFATGVSGTPGIAVDLGGGSGDALKLIGTTGHDDLVLGTTGISLNNDTTVDLTATHVETFVISLDDGDDSLSGAGNATTGAAFPTAFTVYGGAGNDTLRGGAGDDTLYGGAGKRHVHQRRRRRVRRQRHHDRRRRHRHRRLLGAHRGPRRREHRGDHQRPGRRARRRRPRRRDPQGRQRQ